eukprot:augustus_masked-scaffold_55-processed-gene-1.63-mRNA-1 protein AED:1.00 eAED:1.00 QI:0/-1/0/0/-1/1/1/0/929
MADTLSPSNAPTLIPSQSPTLPTASPSIPTGYPTSVDTRVSSQDLSTSFQAYLALFIVLLLVFFLLLKFRQSFSTRTYFPSIFTKANSKLKEDAIPEDPKNVRSFFPKDDDILRVAGLDAYLTVRLNRLACIVFSIWAPIGLIVLASSYATVDQDQETENIQKISMTNLEGAQNADYAFRLSLSCIYILCVLILVLIKLEYENFIDKKLQYLVTHGEESLTVILERIPPFLMAKDKLKKYFEILLGEIIDIEFVPSSNFTKNIQTLKAKRTSVLLALEKAKRKGAKKMVDFNHVANSQLFNREFDVFKVEGSNFQYSVAEEEELKKVFGMATSTPFKSRLISLVSALTCGLLKNVFINKNLASEMTDEEFYDKSLSFLNDFILLQEQRMYKIVELDLTESKAEPIVENTTQSTLDEFEQSADITDEGETLLRKTEKVAAPKTATGANMMKAPLKITGGLLQRGKKLAEELVLRREQSKKDKASTDLLVVRKRMLKSAAFVTFKKRFDSEVSSQVKLSQVLDSMLVTAAKKPDDVIYDNLGVSSLYKIMVRFVIFFANLALLIGFGTFVSSIAISSNLENLRQDNEQLDEFLADNEYLVDVAEQISPFLLVAVFALLPTFIMAVQNISKPLATSDLHSSFYNTYYAFSVLQLFIFYQISGSLTGIVGDNLANPTEIVNIFAQFIPNNAVFFMQYIMIRALLMLPLQYFRVTEIIFYGLRKAFYGESHSERERKYVHCFVCKHIDKIDQPFLASWNASSMLLYTIGITYSILSPLVVVVALGYATVNLFLGRFQLYHVYGTTGVLKPIDSLGSNFRNIMNSWIFSLVLLILTMMGMYGIFARPGLATACLPLLVFIVLVYIYFDKVYSNQLNGLPLASTRLFDIDHTLTKTVDLEVNISEVEGSDIGKGEFQIFHGNYLHPTLKEKTVENI